MFVVDTDLINGEPSITPDSDPTDMVTGVLTGGYYSSDDIASLKVIHPRGTFRFRLRKAVLIHRAHLSGSVSCTLHIHLSHRFRDVDIPGDTTQYSRIDPVILRIALTMAIVLGDVGGSFIDRQTYFTQVLEQTVLTGIDGCRILEGGFDAFQDTVDALTSGSGERIAFTEEGFLPFVEE